MHGFVRITLWLVMCFRRNSTLQSACRLISVSDNAWLKKPRLTKWGKSTLPWAEKKLWLPNSVKFDIQVGSCSSTVAQILLKKRCFRKLLTNFKCYRVIYDVFLVRLKRHSYASFEHLFWCCSARERIMKVCTWLLFNTYGLLFAYALQIVLQNWRREFCCSPVFHDEIVNSIRFGVSPGTRVCLLQTF